MAGSIDHAAFPLPAHRTGRADLPHPALRLASRQGPRRRGWVRRTTPSFMHDGTGELARAASRRLVTPREDVANAIVDGAVDRRIGRQPRAMAEVVRPAPQDAVQLIANIRPGFDMVRLQLLAHFIFHMLHAFARRARPQIPPAILASPRSRPRRWKAWMAQYGYRYCALRVPAGLVRI